MSAVNSESSWSKDDTLPATAFPPGLLALFSRTCSAYTFVQALLLCFSGGVNRPLVNSPAHFYANVYDDYNSSVEAMRN